MRHSGANKGRLRICYPEIQICRLEYKKRLHVIVESHPSCYSALTLLFAFIRKEPDSENTNDNKTDFRKAKFIMQVCLQ